MIDWSGIFYSSIISAALVLSVMGLWLVVTMPGIGRWNKRFFLAYFCALTVSCLSYLVEFFLSIYSDSQAAIYVSLILECLLLTLPLPMLTVYLLHCCGDNVQSSKLLPAVLGLWALYCILLVISQFIDIFQYIAAENMYYRGAMYPILLMPLIAILLLNFAGVIRRRKQLSHRIFLGFLIALVPMTAALLVLLFTDFFPFLDIAYVLSALSMYSFALSDQVEQDQRRQREIANQRASIMVLQMRPHFIYNTLTTIYCLCKQNPELAQQVIMDFTSYLRKNFTAIASETPIPFSSELEHTRAYLAVEQAQYEDSLIVDYDTPHTMFRLPPLTLQPIVENAVKHGRDPYAGPFHISIRTRKTEDGSQIIVADDGRGFQPADDSAPHIALKNIQERLEMMCGGSLAITPNDGGGTVVTLTIPDRQEDAEAKEERDIHDPNKS